MFDLDSIPWADGCDPQDRVDVKYKRSVKLANRTKRQRKKRRDAVDAYNASIEPGTLRKFYV